MVSTEVIGTAPGVSATADAVCITEDRSVDLLVGVSAERSFENYTG